MKNFNCKTPFSYINTKFILFLFFIQISLINFCFSQFIIAGQTGPGIYYHDLFPDIELNAYLSHLPGDTSTSIGLDLDLDGKNDFNFIASRGAGVSHSISATIIYPDSNNQVSYSRNVTVYNPMSGNFSTVIVAKAFNLGDTIHSDPTFTNNGWRALNYYYSRVGHGTFTINDWTQAGEKYIGIRLINLVDTTYGWIRVETPSAAKMLIKDYALNNSLNGLEEHLSKKQLIYPNPATKNLTIILNKKANIIITNLFGDILLEKNIISDLNGTVNLDISYLSSGIYFIKVDNEVWKFIKE